MICRISGFARQVYWVNGLESVGKGLGVGLGGGSGVGRGKMKVI